MTLDVTKPTDQSLVSTLPGYIRATRVAVNGIASGDTWMAIDVVAKGADPTGLVDSTDAIQDAIDECVAAGGGSVLFPPGTYLVDGAAHLAIGRWYYGLELHSHVWLIGMGDVTIKLMDGSTDSLIDPILVWSNNDSDLENVIVSGITFNGNSANNQLTNTVPDARNVAPIWFGGIQGGASTIMKNIRIRDCRFIDWSGMSVIVIYDSNNSGDYSEDVQIERCYFYDVAKGTNIRDHSTIFLQAKDSSVSKCIFTQPLTATDLQRQLSNACELHGHNTSFIGNKVTRFEFGAYAASTLREDTYNYTFSDNQLFDVAGGFVLIVSGTATYTVHNVVVKGNLIKFTSLNNLAHPYAQPWKQGLMISVLKSGLPAFWPNSVTFEGNTVIGNPTTTDLQIGVGPQRNRPAGAAPYGFIRTLNVVGNTFIGINHGIYFDGSLGTADTQFFALNAHGNIYADLFLTGGDASGILVTGYGHPHPRSVHVSGETFTNEADEATYKYGIILTGNIERVSIGENQFYNMKTGDVTLSSLVFTTFFGYITATSTWNPDSVSATSQTSTTITVAGAALGDPVTVSFSLDLELLQLTAYVSAANTVTVILANHTLGAINLGSGTLKVRVRKGA